MGDGSEGVSGGSEGVGDGSEGVGDGSEGVGDRSAKCKCGVFGLLWSQCKLTLCIVVQIQCT